MEVPSLLNIILIISILLSALILKFITQKHTTPRNLPPNPPALPIIGHLHLLKQPVHRTLHQLSEKYGPILLLQFGTRKVLLVSSASAAEECFTKNDSIFANRPQLLAGKHMNYNNSTIGLAPYGDYWRSLRRLTTMELFSTSRLAMFASIRQEEVQLLVKELFVASTEKPAKVKLTSKLIEVVFNIILRIIAGKRYYGKDAVDKEGEEFRDIMREVTEIHGSAHLNDFFPALQWVDFQGVERRMKEAMKKTDKFLQSLVEEHRKMREDKDSTDQPLGSSDASNKGTKPTLIDIMLSLQQTEPEFYTDQTIKAVIWTVIGAGTETSSTIIEWAMSLLLNHPGVMHKAWTEIATEVGQDKLLDETDLPKLNYLQSIISESMRLFPPTPLLLPHESTEDCVVCDYNVPRGTMLFINAWTIQRDPKLWEDATRFMPERFEGGEPEGYKLLPFGVGRRACPGAVLGRKVVGLVLGSLIQSFEWNRIGEEEIDMKEGTGLTMPKAEPLVALCSPRPGMVDILSTI
ncbi:cytochrome P450, family 81, subfamily D, polypeptide 5 [Hibiscus trionum]|uniref:Cytochrome P450, family 81, subfamily D, polypeptide 5 n=1 Tax=Hibiscus trionum TaxID=183268 RepID=A0A9W7HVG0_HIBTR|nr:cytochrome P450, family 81, subfamily D, polypeptide 5 [Hibiscus trionum]